MQQGGANGADNHFDTTCPDSDVPCDEFDGRRPGRLGIDAGTVESFTVLACKLGVDRPGAGEGFGISDRNRARPAG